MARSTSRGSRVLMTGPLAPFADAYRAELLERGYAPLTVVSELRQAARFSWWLEAGDLTVAEVSEARVEEFLEWQRVNWRHRHSWSRPGLRCLLDVLRGLGLVVEEPAVPGSPTDVLLAGFERYLLAERGLAAGTVALYLACVRRFVEGLAPDRGVAGLVAGDEMSREGVPLLVIQRQLGHADLAITSVYLRGIDNTEIVHAVHERPAPMIPRHPRPVEPRQSAWRVVLARPARPGTSPLGRFANA